MTQFYQITDSKDIMVLPNKLRFNSVEPINETSGGDIVTYYFQIPDDTSLIKRAWDITRRTKNQTVAQEARKLLSIIRDTITVIPQIELDSSYLPRFNAFNVDDGSVLIEWKFDDFRIGFSIEPNIEESGWYLVSNKNLGEISASGYISYGNFRGLILWLINFVFLIYNLPKYYVTSLTNTYQGSM